MGIAVAVAGAVGLQTLFVSVEANYRYDTGADPSRADLVSYVALDGDWDDVRAVEATLRATAGVRAVRSRVWVVVSFPPAPGSPEDGFGDLGSLLTIADCSGLREIAEIDSCGEGDVFITEPSADNSWGPVPGPGSVLTLDAWPGEPAQTGSGEWTVPDTARVVTARTDPVGGSQFGVLATPSAFPAANLASRSRQVSSFVDMDRSDPAVVENVRNVLWAHHPTNSSHALVATGESANFVEVRRGLLGGAIVTLILIGVSLLVSVLEQLRERRRVLAGLMAFGTRRRTLALSILWQTVVPVALGMVLAVGAGVSVGAILLAIANESISVDWASVGLMAGVAASVVVAVTVLSMPVLWRVMRADGLHTE